MADKEYVCAYKYCLHHGNKVKSSEAVVLGKKYYHWDCAATKQEISEIRNIYIERIDNKASFSIVSKVLNDLVFKYNLEPEFIKFAVCYYADYKFKIKSPFTLLYLRKNNYMREKWERSKGVSCCL